MSVAPSPKSHAHMVGFPVERSVNRTVNGAFPSLGSAAKSAMITFGETVTNWVFITVSELYWFDAVRVTE